MQIAGGELEPFDNFRKAGGRKVCNLRELAPPQNKKDSPQEEEE